MGNRNGSGFGVRWKKTCLTLAAQNGPAGGPGNAKAGVIGEQRFLLCVAESGSRGWTSRTGPMLEGIFEKAI